MSKDDHIKRGLDLTDLGAEAAAQEKLVFAAPVPPAPVEPQIAIALKYERAKDPAPVIKASGRGAVAEQILQLAFANGVKVREDADLAEVLSHLDIETPIPLEAYAAVAEILAYVYRANAGHTQRKQ